jgi:pimeloyl-ACP methyl ester carboxylesterase
MSRREVDTNHDVTIPLQHGRLVLRGRLQIPELPLGLVVFVHGSGSGRFSPRNQYVADVLGRAGFATLLFDLLTVEEEERDRATAQWRFDIALLSERLVGVSEWLAGRPEVQGLPLGYFGASTGAAAALVAAARMPARVRAVVSRGGRPDLALPLLSRVQAPTLLIVGADDTAVIELNQRALAQIRAGRRQLVLVPHATHLFEEPGALEEVARLASDWFRRHIAGVVRPLASTPR